MLLDRLHLIRNQFLAIYSFIEYSSLLNLVEMNDLVLDEWMEDVFSLMLHLLQTRKLKELLEKNLGWEFQQNSAVDGIYFEEDDEVSLHVYEHLVSLSLSYFSSCAVCSCSWDAGWVEFRWSSSCLDQKHIPF